MFWLPTGFDGEEGGTAGTGGEATKTYSQEEFDRHMGGLRKKYESQVSQLKTAQEQLAEQLRAAQQNPGLSDEEREAYAARIDALEQSYLSKQQLSERNAVKKEKELQSLIENLQAENGRWRGSYQDEVVRNQIYLDTSRLDGVDPEQFARILGPDISWKEIPLEDGNGTSYEPRVKFADTDKEGKPVTVELTIRQAMERMKELDRYSNLYKSGVKSGVGGGPNSGGAAGGQQITQTMLSRNPELLRKILKENPRALDKIPA